LRYIIILILIYLFLLSSIAIEPNVPVLTIFDYIDKCALYHKLDAKLVRAIIQVESEWKNLYNKKTKDFGLMQINIYNIKALGLNQDKMQNNPFYNVTEGIKILAWFRDRYERKLGKRWLTKYNCGTRRKCENTRKSKKYLAKVLHHLNLDRNN
jgi:hypothetical protein